MVNSPSKIDEKKGLKVSSIDALMQKSNSNINSSTSIDSSPLIRNLNEEPLIINMDND
jgi:hypothetical protein